MFITSLQVLFPLFLVAAGGFLLASRFSLSEDTLVRIVTDFFMPVLVFYSLSESDMERKTLLSLGGAVLLILGILFLLSFIYCKVTGQKSQTFIPPVIFMNSGFLGIPLMKLWGGMAAMNMIVIYDQIQTVCIFTIGILIVTGGITRQGLKEIIKSPLLWAIIAGFAWKALPFSLPPFIGKGLDFIGIGATPLATFTLGVSLKSRSHGFSAHLIPGILLRVIGGFFAGLLAVTLFRLTGTARTVVLIASSLPSAVFSYVLPARYGLDARFPGSMVLFTSLLGVVTIPLAFWLSSVL